MDYRLIKNIENIEGVLDKINKINAIGYTDKNTEKHSVGVIAQEVLLQYPELVNRTPNGYYVVDYQKLAVILLAAVQELQREVQTMKKHNRKKADVVV